ncbi:serine/threonine-protein kinase [Oscillatoria sp. CS-180]|uniref:serine/threonine-protein kinase n=1 Tax=Oscillatoria sp. CS-180 TaxID=3021720 RepID=UPI00232C89CA|nr:serine/threonine-protein kinase [Oscillatoria sp. CS-180]MDB9528548.1 serine/threonine-protein kinase [Oscillatoria sp. CS-180]
MYPPLPPGTVLQSRYRILKSLGQGGFGRTYLAEDQGRYQEHCAVKEFSPPHGEDVFSSKATELFQREAAILYQIQHPQIPKFRATFEIERRLFLVQDYVEGPSYRDLLNQRRSQNTTFSEAEVRQFLRQILPVLAHIHAKGIIHRDISPDNILLRNRDRLPVLIDFGVVKEVVTRVQMAETTYHATTVGKPGYAPSEQMQSGRAYPSSDLYSLAVTAIVLLTGREPQDIFDDVNLTWSWQQYTSISPGLAQVLSKATNYRPGDRYQSVSEMAQALGAAGNLASPVMPPIAYPQQPSPQPAPPSSQMRTVAVGRPPQSTTMVGPEAPRTSRLPTPSVLDDNDSSVWENPFAIGALALILALVAGLGGWGIVNALNRGPARDPAAETPTIEIEPERPVITPSPEPETTPEPVEPEPVEYNQTLGIRAGESTTVEGTLQDNETVNYVLEGREGETLTAQLEGEGVLMTVLAPNGNPPDARSRRVLGWTGPLEFTGQYTLQLSPVEGVEQSNYSLEVALAPDEASDEPDESAIPDEDEPETPTEPEQPDETPDEPIEPSIVSEQRVRFPEGQDSILVANSAGPGRVRRYVVNLQAGQVLSVEISNSTGPTTFSVLLPTDDPLASSVQLWEEAVPVGGDYAIDVIASEDSEFTLRFGVQ